jgi:hypothetical protein
MTPVFNSVQLFSFTLDIIAPLEPGTFSNPALNSVQYSVLGTLGSTPSGFPGFNLQRTITGTDFYAQGSSLQFTIGAGADLTDGLQVSELTGSNPVFLFDGREVGTGRYHPPLFQLNSDGTGSIRNSNNFGGINPTTQQMVDVDYGEEYIVNLSFVPTDLTLATPEPATGVTFGLALAAAMVFRRRYLRAGSGR